MGEYGGPGGALIQLLKFPKKLLLQFCFSGSEHKRENARRSGICRGEGGVS